MLFKAFDDCASEEAAERRNSFTDLATGTVPDSHLHPLDLSHVRPIAHKVLHAASAKGFLSFWQVQPQTVCLDFAGAHDDDIHPGSGAGFTVDRRGQREMIRDDYERKRIRFNIISPSFKVQPELVSYCRFTLYLIK